LAVVAIAVVFDTNFRVNLRLTSTPPLDIDPLAHHSPHANRRTSRHSSQKAISPEAQR